MKNPWEKIDLEVYEKHMSHDNVYQLQKLNEIMKEQFQDNKHENVGVLGVAGGNGLNNIDISNVRKVFAIDVNREYLNVCRERYDYMGEILETICRDINDKEFSFPKTDLIVCNLIIEYIGEEQFVAIVERNKENIKLISCVIQDNEKNSFVSDSEYSSHFTPITSINHDINDNKLKNLFAKIGFNCIKIKSYNLPNNKSFIRMDFKKV
ncbi:class I SAM-dependent methyltransferase [Clostridium intestinale]|uniref:class I SAM-dependent methyltransferase n=1 Tax=Clostridium intestinale TaxID=36845 RepID=UPI002DD69B40|nr:class I SAM-dependent methyltransferase [Clostridium intestinale]WRY52273.1 class I SAM-dependent methyltransferase [Clostridium intestinale]